MRKYLSGGAGTGTKIIENHNIFRYEFKGIEKLKDNKIMYHFNWGYDNYQHGFINIVVNEGTNSIDESSVMSTDKGSPRSFNRPLGLYNDKSLYTVYKGMIQKVDER